MLGIALDRSNKVGNKVGTTLIYRLDICPLLLTSVSASTKPLYFVMQKPANNSNAPAMQIRIIVPFFIVLFY